MKLAGSKSLLRLQLADQASTNRRHFRNFLVILSVAVIALFLETGLNFHERLDTWLAALGSDSTDSLLVIALCVLVCSLLLQMYDMAQEIARRRAAEIEVLTLAHFDPLTKLPNRRKLDEHITQLKPGLSYAVMMLDLDDFKPVNDIFGHAAGDSVLIQASSRIAAACGGKAFVARFGGDEFAIVSEPITKPEFMDEIASQITGAFEPAFTAADVETRMTISIGITLLKAGEKTGEDAIREADLALYRAKEGGLPGYCIFEKTIEDELRRRKLIERKLRLALDLGTVTPFYQPLVNLKTSEVIGFEALARWTDDELGEIAPSEFIPIAEKCGLIFILSDHLLRTACADAVQWPGHLTLSFNLSPKQFRDKLVGLRILRVLGETGLAPHRLEIEITESSLSEDKELAQETLKALRQAGIRISIDDFGTGYSSLYHLREFHFDTLKIDRSFISTMQQNALDSVIVRAMLNLSQGLGLLATAEGIEHEDQVSSLISSGCEQGQGFLFGKAMPQQDVLNLIDEGSDEALSA